jgi:CheY-like chemotaxis protein
MALRILFVDDDEAFRYALSNVLRAIGFNVTEAANYQEALSVIEDGVPLSLLLIDIALPVVHGFALARMARMRRIGLPTIYISAFDVPNAEALGPVLRKPLDTERLLAEIKNLLD